MAQKMYSRQEVEALDVGGVVNFAQEQGLDQEDVAVLRKEKIDGSVLERMTVDGFMKAGMKMGPAVKLMKALDKVFGRGSSGDTENKGQDEEKVTLTQSAIKGIRKLCASGVKVTASAIESKETQKAIMTSLLSYLSSLGRDDTSQVNPEPST